MNPKPFPIPHYPVTERSRSITHYPLPITHYPLPITHSPFPITLKVSSTFYRNL
ncbi:MAG: hypothetical protein ACRC78_12390 [Planktothrix sp.]